MMPQPSSSARFLNKTIRAQMENQGASQVWAEVTALARLPGVLDLGQGWPDFGANTVAREAASQAILSDDDPKSNQYSPPPGAPMLVHAVERYYRATGSVNASDERNECVVTTSATEALYTCMQTLIDPGDEVVFIEPFFPWYIAHCKIFGAKVRTVRLKQAVGANGEPMFKLAMEDLRAAFEAGKGKVKCFIFNAPHNPTGVVFNAQELTQIAKLCVEFDVLILADEVYERCTFSEQKMTRIADVDIPGVKNRTLTIGTASKLLNLSGWRVGWIVGPTVLIEALRTMHSYATFCAPTPLQLGVAAALREIADKADEATREKALRTAQKIQSNDDANTTLDSTRVAAFQATPGSLVPDASAKVMAQNAQVLSLALFQSGVVPYAPSGGYFLVADVSSTKLTAIDYCKRLAIGPAKVAAVPMDVFFDPSNENVPNTLVRFAICKKRETIEECAASIRKYPLGERKRA